MKERESQELKASVDYTRNRSKVTRHSRHSQQVDSSTKKEASLVAFVELSANHVSRYRLLYIKLC